MGILGGSRGERECIAVSETPIFEEISVQWLSEGRHVPGDHSARAAAVRRPARTEQGRQAEPTGPTEPTDQRSDG